LAGDIVSHIPIYTIGYGNRSIQEFIRLLKQYDISYLIDIRSRPYSRFNPNFSKEALEKLVKQFRIRYIFMGDTLGGRPEDSSCYEDGHVNYDLLSEKQFYKDGIKRIQKAWEGEFSVALMCSEAKPYECHRGKLIGDTLLENGIEVAHIDEKGDIKKQEEIKSILMGENADQLSLFDKQSLKKKIRLSRKKYTPQGGQI